MPTPSGMLRHRGTIQCPNEIEDEFGGSKLIWNDVTTRYMGIEPISGREFLADGQVQSQVTHRIRMRSPNETISITTKMRIKHGCRIFNIEHIRDVNERGFDMELMCREEVD